MKNSNNTVYGVKMTTLFPFFYNPLSSLARTTVKILVHLLENISLYVHTHKFSFSFAFMYT